MRVWNCVRVMLAGVRELGRMTGGTGSGSMNFVRVLVSIGTGNPAAAAAEQREGENQGVVAAVPTRCFSRLRRFSEAD
ncbi:hypothetical protein LBMAG46_41110 [Planctomycetia bacterium]|nr:hypothetical protein LBMAG46_41110 [Planctomycetia bacterium]